MYSRKKVDSRIEPSGTHCEDFHPVSHGTMYY